MRFRYAWRWRISSILCLLSSKSLVRNLDHDKVLTNVNAAPETSRSFQLTAISWRQSIFTTVSQQHTMSWRGRWKSNLGVIASAAHTPLTKVDVPTTNFDMRQSWSLLSLQMIIIQDLCPNSQQPRTNAYSFMLKGEQESYRWRITGILQFHIFKGVFLASQALLSAFFPIVTSKMEEQWHAASHWFAQRVLWKLISQAFKVLEISPESIPESIV